MLDLLRRLFDSGAAPAPARGPATSGPPPARSRAMDEMRRLNPNAVWGREGGREVFIEDVIDPDGRIYRIEYQCDAAGNHAVAYCRHNPWGGNPFSVHQSHLFDGGQICLGSGGFSLRDAVLRSRYWCTAYSYLREHGTFPNP